MQAEPKVGAQMKNGKDIGDGYLVALKAYLSEGAVLPLSSKDGTLNLTELHRITGIPKSTFYQNPLVKKRLDEALVAQGISRKGDVPKPASRTPAIDHQQHDQSVQSDTGHERAKQLLERKLHKCEQHNGVLVAEVCELRRQLKEVRLQLGREDMMMETGFRIPAALGAA